jgi:hypothetical protein
MNMDLKLVEYFTSGKRQPLVITFFVKALIVFAMFKTITLWSVADIFLQHKQLNFLSLIAKLVFLPSMIALEHTHWFFAIVLLILGALLFLRPNYFTNGILFWIVFNLFRLRFPVTNGSDYVLLVLSAYTIPLSFLGFQHQTLRLIDTTLFNLFVWLIKLQVVFIYFISGWDKLLSPVWTSGEAFLYIPQIVNVYNPIIEATDVGGTSALLMSWTTIIFELAFVVLIWQKRTRPWILCVGVIFHLIIWIMLSLPDFALIMMISYIPFIERNDLSFLRERFIPQLR